jgi:hypothetical protein
VKADTTIADTLGGAAVIVHHVYHSARDSVLVNFPQEK